jgi:uncharacterized protein
MKYLLLFFIFLVIAFQWRQSRKPKVHKAAQKKGPAKGAANMVACAQCGLHLPEAEAVKGKNALYCCNAHRQALEP